MFEILASKMAMIHSLRLPFSRSVDLANYLLSMITNLKSNSVLLDYRSGSKVNQWSERLCSFNYSREINWLISILDSIPSKVVFCHRDLNRSYILIRERKSIEHGTTIKDPFEFFLSCNQLIKL